jgi:outer membrane receptor protein involved in Fe transport
MGYLRFATGYRPGGPNTNQLAAGFATFQSDSLKSYEAGYKSETVDRRFSADLAVYYIDWNDIQIAAVRNAQGIILNAPGGATVRGAEITLGARPISNSLVTATLGFQDPTLKSDAPDLGGVAGERLPNVPKVTASLNADYSLSATGTRPTIGGTFRYIGDRTISFSNGASAAGIPPYKLPSYTQLDLRAGMSFGTVDMQFYVHNVTDERGQLYAYTVYGLPYVAISQPRTFGLMATVRY